MFKIFNHFVFVNFALGCIMRGTMNECFISDLFALAAGGSGFTRVRVKSQTERIALLGSRLFQISVFLLILLFFGDLITGAYGL